ncbi:MAG: arginine--tRNA ligase [Candidatus Aenigmarchaeota archaeon]|nr:arginine--tRNA ligase [Candidatus Aenigmarchaeota archaeon]
MMPSSRFRFDVVDAIHAAADLPRSEIEELLEKPPGGIGADLALPCFLLAKSQHKDPRLIAREIADKIKPTGMIREANAIGAYVNFYADWDRMNIAVLQQIADRNKDFGKAAKPKGKVMVEFCHANTHKAFHIGHVRNISYGESLSRILEAAGYRVVRANYQGDIGPHVAKCLWGFIKLHKGRAPKGKESKGRWLGEVYAEASRKAKESEKVGKEAEEINSKLYARDKKILAAWKKTRSWSLGYFKDIYRDFGVKFNRLYFESEVEKPGAKAAKELLRRKIAKKSDGAVIVDLNSEDLGVFVLLTKEGNPLYSAKDLGLAALQMKEYRPDRIVHVVGSEQKHYFNQLFRTLELAKSPAAGREEHLSYELVNLPTGKMKSREGSVILYDDLRDEMVRLAEKESLKKNPKMKKRQLKKIAEQVGLGAIKFSMLNTGPDKVIVFDPQKAASIDENSGPYLQYAYTRACSIMSKASGTKKREKLAAPIKNLIRDVGMLKEEKELALIKILNEFPDVVEQAARLMHPHVVAGYATRLAITFNEFYEMLPVLKAEEDVRNARLVLVEAVRAVMRNALHLLGMEAPEKM